jgi:hypothetical protein
MNSDIVRRIAIVKQLYGIAIETAQKPNPLNAFSILPLHDSVEMFMQLAVEYKKAPLSAKTTFDQYWSSLEAAGAQIGSREGMRRLNSARVALKHSGLLPDRQEISGFVDLTTNFLIESCLTIFDIDWNSVSRAFLIHNETLRKRIEDAELAIRAGDHAKALAQLKIAFDLAITNRGHDGLYDPRDRISSINFFNFGSSGGLGTDKTAKALKQLSDVFGEALMVVGYRLDFDGYRLLKTHSPVVHYTVGGGSRVEWMHTPTDDSQIVAKCADFVIDTCLRLQSIGES